MTSVGGPLRRRDHDDTPQSQPSTTAAPGPMPRPLGRMEHQARWWLWLVPAWLRATRGEEIVATVLDLVPSATTRLPWRSHLDLIRAGLSARRRGTPPVRTWLTVITAGRGGRAGFVDPSWRPWLASRLDAWNFAWQCGLLRCLLGTLPLAAYWLFLPPQARFSSVGFFGLYVGCALLGTAGWVVLSRSRWRTDLARKNAIDLGARRPFDDVRWAWYPQRCRNVTLAPLAVAIAIVSGPVAAILAAQMHAVPMRSAGASRIAALLLSAAMPATVVLQRTRVTKSASASAVTWHHPVFTLGCPVLATGVLASWFGHFVDPVVLGGAVSFSGVLLLTAALAGGHRRGAPVGIWDLFRSLGPWPALVPAGEAS